MNQLLKRNPKTAWRKYGDEAVVITLEDQRVHQFNSTATYIWESLETPTEEQTLCTILLNEFDIDQDTLKRDCKSFISTLTKNKLVITDN